MDRALDTVVVTTDFSPFSEHALRRAAQLPLAPQARIVVTHALPLEIPESFARRVEKGATAQLRDDVTTLKRLLRERDVRQITVRSAITRGPTAEALAEVCREEGADLIVAGRHGQRRFGEQLVGTTVERLVRFSETPVLVVSGTKRGAYRRPLTAVDLTDSSRAAIDMALVLAPQAAAYRMIHAFEHGYELVLHQTNASATKIKAYRDEQRQLAAETFRTFVAPYGAITERFALVLSGDEPRGAILAAIEREKVDLVTLGTTARTGIGRLLVGSTAVTVLRHATCDVLVAREVPRSRRKSS